jgi:hypothetical protein
MTAEVTLLPRRQSPLEIEITRHCTRIAGAVSELAMMMPDAWQGEVGFIIGAVMAAQAKRQKPAARSDHCPLIFAVPDIGDSPDDPPAA